MLGSFKSLLVMDRRDKRHMWKENVLQYGQWQEDLPRDSQGMVRTREQTYVLALLTKGSEKRHLQPGKCHFFSTAEIFWSYQLRFTVWFHLRPIQGSFAGWAPHQSQAKYVLASQLSHSRGSLVKWPSHLKIHFHPAASARLECKLRLGKHGFTCFN